MSGLTDVRGVLSEKALLPVPFGTGWEKSRASLEGRVGETVGQTGL